MRWLPVKFSIDFKVRLPIFEALNGWGPSYIKLYQSHLFCPPRYPGAQIHCINLNRVAPGNAGHAWSAVIGISDTKDQLIAPRPASVFGIKPTIPEELRRSWSGCRAVVKRRMRKRRFEPCIPIMITGNVPSKWNRRTGITCRDAAWCDSNTTIPGSYPAGDDVMVETLRCPCFNKGPRTLHVCDCCPTLLWFAHLDSPPTTFICHDHTPYPNPGRAETLSQVAKGKEEGLAALTV